MAGFVATATGEVRVELEEHEAELMRQLLDEMHLLLDADIPKQDAVMGRLFPPAYEDDPEQETYARMTEDELRTAKLEALAKVRDTVGGHGAVATTILPQDAHAWLTLMNDVRLAIGTRLDVTEEKMAADIDPESREGPAYSVLHWLGWMQEMLLAAVDPRYDDPASET